MISEFIGAVISSAENIGFDKLIWIIWGSFAGVFALIFILCFLTPKIRSAGKRPFLCLVNAYSAITLACFLTFEELVTSLVATVLFWLVAYVLYGALCLVTKKPKEAGEIIPAATVTSMPVAVTRTVRGETPTAKSSVRLEHAVSVTDKLLQKNLGKSDRQELEKLKNTLAVLQIKGTLSPTEADILNDNFNALLKLMAKYNV